jgi:hypothetical protein
MTLTEQRGDTVTYVGPPSVSKGVCLHCGRAKTSLKRGDICGTEGGYEYVELIDEWPQHRWRGWSDAELERFHVKAEAYDRYRRANVSYFEWMPCDDSTVGHHPATRDDPEWGIRVGQCTLGGKQGVAESPQVS